MRFAQARHCYSRDLTLNVSSHVLDVIKARWKEFEAVFSSPAGTTVSVGDLTSNMFCLQFWQQCLPWALRQAEESYCDFVGLRIFGESYLSAFAYILSPSTEGTRSIQYPNLQKRVANLIAAANSYGLSPSAKYLDLFEDMAVPNLIQSAEFLLSVADGVLELMTHDLIKRASSDVETTGIPLPSKSEEDRIIERLRLVVPAEQCRSLADILNAGWRAYESHDLWETVPNVKQSRDRNLKELILKNFEVFEIEHILKE